MVYSTRKLQYNSTSRLHTRTYLTTFYNTTVRCINEDTIFLIKISMLKNLLKNFFHENSKKMEEMK